MNFINKLERKLGRYAISNLMLYLTILYTVGLVISFMSPQFYVQYLSLNAYAITRGQIWRIITWIMYPPTRGILGIVMIFVYYNIGTTLAGYWGDFRFNLFIFTGVILHIIAAFVLYAVKGIESLFYILTPNNMNLSILLAFMLSFPDAQFLLFFFIPIRAWVLGIVYVILTILNFVTGGLGTRVEIVASVLNVILFMWMTGMLSSLRWRIKQKWPNSKNRWR